MSCSGLNSLVGSHQRCASWLNFSSSTGSTLATPDLLRPRRSSLCELARIESGERAVFHAQAAVYPDVRDVLASSRVHEMRSRVVERREFEVGQPHGGDV